MNGEREGNSGKTSGTESQQWIQQILESTAEGILVVNGSGTIVYLNSSAQYLLRSEGDRLLGVPFSTLFQDDLKPTLDDFLSRIRASGQKEQIELCLGSVSDATRVDLLVSAAPIVGQKNDTLVMSLLDWSARRKKIEKMRSRIEELSETLGELGVEHVQLWETSEKLETMAVFDDLTKLYNRRYFSMRGKEEYARALRHNLHLGVLLMDLDFFKKVNDEMGHLFGDAVLSQSGMLIHNVVRVSDVAVRFGGEEFLILAPETDLKGVQRMGERLREAFEKHLFIHGGATRRVTISVGGTCIPPFKFKDLEGVVEQADKALYKAKEERNKVVCLQ